ncbi:MAG: AsmA family protein [Nitrospirota bacterium]
MKKVLSIISAIIIVVIMALFLLVKFYITPERIKAFLIPAAEEALNREVQIEEISISLFKGIEARNFSIKEADGKTDFLKSKEFILKYKLLPLLSKQIIIDEFRIISPEIRIVRDSQGRFNFESIGEQKSQPAEEEIEEQKEPEGLPVSLLVSRLVIDNAVFHLKDHKKELPQIEGIIDIDTGIKSADNGGLLSEGSINLKLKEVVLKGPPQKNIKNISVLLKYAVNLNLESDSLKIEKADLKIQDISTSIAGDIINLSASPEINVSVSLPKTDTGAIMKLVASFVDVNNLSISGDLSSDLKIRGMTDKLETEAHITLSKVKTVYQDMSAAIDGTINLIHKTDSIRIDKSSFTIQKIPVSLEGELTDLDKTPKINLDLSIPKSKAANLLAAAGPFADTKDISLSGDIKAYLNLRGIPEKIKTLKANGRISFISLGAKYKDLNAMLNGDLSLKSNDVMIKKMDLKIEEVPVSVAGSVRNIIDSPSIDMSVSLPRTDAQKIQKLVGNFTDLKGIALSGKLRADLKLNGKPEKLDTLKATGNVKLEKVGVTYNKINAVLDGGLKIGKKSIDINLRTTYGRNNAQIRGTVTDYFKNQNIKLNVYSKKLFIDELEPLLNITDKPSSEKAKSSIQSKGSLKRTSAEAEPVDLKLTASGEVKIDYAVYKGMDINDFNMKYSFKNNILNLTETGRTGKGRFNIKTLLDLSKRGYKYTMSGNVDSIYVEEFVNAFFPKAKDTIFGILTSDFRLNGAGTLPGNMKKNLVANGDFDLKEGKITNVPIAKDLSLLFNIRDLETINLDQARGTVNISNGTARLDSLFTSKDLTMDPKGDIGLEGDLDLAFDIKLSPRLTRKAMSSNVSEYLKDEQGWSSIPIICPGTFEKPACGPDPEKAVKQVIGKEINKFLNKLINKKRKDDRPQSPRQEESREEEPANPLEDILKQLPGLLE